MIPNPRVLVGCIGNTWEPGVWDALLKASQHVVDQGGKAEIMPIGNVCVEPYHGLAMMRNLAIIEALSAGATHMLLVDNDILFEDEAAIWKLLQWKKLAIVPWKDQGALDASYRFNHPNLEKGQSLKLLEWSVMSCVLWDMDVWRAKGVDVRLFHDHMAVDEDAYYWRYLSLFGVQCWQDTDTEVKVLRRPTPMWKPAEERGCVVVSQNGTQVKTEFRRT